MKQRMIIIVGLVAVAVGVGIVLSELTRKDETERALGPETRQITHFTDGQKERVLRILKADPMRRQLTNNSPYTTPEVIPWISATGDRLIGGMVTLELGRTINTEPANWPVVILPTASVPNPLPGKRYLRRVVRLSSTGVSKVTAFIDLEKNSVVGLEPGGPGYKVKYIRAYGAPPGKAYQRPKGY